ncbi:unnamed protein product [Calicophoron daubneyi]|uniref:BZIP domain-containing protein n=1 Tax=Calicophoron daubneyi TaxID=300641 RepID=A0AAV2TPQ9_CALDB
MFNDLYQLKDLFDNKSEKLRVKSLRSQDERTTYTTDSAFLGPTLWDDCLTISDLDDIVLDEFSPPSFTSSAAESWDYPQDPKEQNEEFEPEDMKKRPPEPSNSSTPIQTINWKAASGLPESVTMTLSLPSKVGPTRKKSHVPPEQKNEKYWNRRMKNNASAKRSRDARRMMENQVYMKAVLLEQENAEMKLEISRLTAENQTLRQLLAGSSQVLLPPVPSASANPSVSAPQTPDPPKQLHPQGSSPAFCQYRLLSQPPQIADTQTARISRI